MPLKIAYITDERYPSVHTDTQQVIKTAQGLGKQGCEVDLILPKMARHVLLGRGGVKRRICDYYNVRGDFEVRPILTWPASDLRAEKLFHGIVSPLAATFGKYDVVYTRNLIPLRIAASLGAPVLFETYRALPKSNPRAWRTVKVAMGGSRFVGISTHSAYSRQIMIDDGVSPDLIAAVPNGYDPDDFDAVEDRDTLRSIKGLPLDRQICVYTGHIRPDKGVDSLLDLAEDRPEALFLLVGGDRDDVGGLRSSVEGRGLDNVRLEGRVSLTEVARYLSLSDVLLLPPTAKPLMSHGNTVLPMKTFTYLAAGRPILAPDLLDTEGILVNERNSLRVAPDDRRAASDALERLLGNAELCRRLGENAREDSTRYTWDERARRMVSFIEDRLSRMA